MNKIIKRMNKNNKKQLTKMKKIMNRTEEHNEPMAIWPLTPVPVSAAEVLAPAASILMGPCESKKARLWNDVLSWQSPRPSCPSPFPPADNTRPRAAQTTTTAERATTCRGRSHRSHDLPVQMRVWFRPQETRRTWSDFSAETGQRPLVSIC